MFLYGSPLDNAQEFGALIRAALMERAVFILHGTMPTPILDILGPKMLMDVQNALAGATFDVIRVCDCDGNEDVLACERCGAIDVHFDVEWDIDREQNAIADSFLDELTMPNMIRVPMFTPGLRDLGSL